MNDIIIVYIPADMESQILERGTEVLRIHIIPGVTLAELAETLVNQTIEKTDELIKEFTMPPHIEIAPKKNTKHKQFLLRQSIKRFNIINQYRKQTLFNRTKHK